MGLTQQVQAQYQSMPKSVTRTGVAADLATQHTVDLFTIAGGDILLVGILGRVVGHAKANTAQTLRLGLMPAGSITEAFLCGVSGVTNLDAIDTVYTITGVIANAMIVAPTALGVSLLQAAATGMGVGAPQILVAGVIRLTTADADDNAGFIDWTVIYQPLTDASVVTVL